jgi:opacity protein-like surface antigen
MKIAALIAAFFLAAGAARAEAAVVTLKDGSILRGAVVGQTADGLQLSTPDGTLHIGLDRVLRVDYVEEAAPPPLPDLPSPGEAAPSSRRQFVSVGIGLMEPVGSVNFHSIGGGSADNGDLGGQVGVQYVYFLTPRLGAGLDFDYFNRGGTISERLYPSASASVGGDTDLLLAVLRYSLADRGTARPFVLVGAGGGWNTTTVDVRPAVWADTGTHETRRLIDDGAWVPAASVRLGVDLDLGALQPGVVTFELGWTGLASARYGATPQGQALGLSGVSGPLNIISFTARCGWRL